MATDKVMVNRSKLDALVNAYNTLTGETSKLTLDQLATAISEIETGGGDPSEDLQTVLENPETGFSITNNANRIVAYSFYNRKLVTASFPKATSVGGAAFYSCTNLKSISVPNAIDINNSAFYSCSALTEVDFGQCEIVYGDAFVFCSNLTTVNLPKCTKFTGAAFNGCSRLQNVNIPVVREIGQRCFNGCRMLESLEFKSNVTAINAQAFYGCSTLTKVIFNGNTAVPALGNANAFTNTPIASGTGYIYVPDSLVEDWKVADRWSTYAAQIKPLSELPE